MRHGETPWTSLINDARTGAPIMYYTCQAPTGSITQQRYSSFVKLLDSVGRLADGKQNNRLEHWKRTLLLEKRHTELKSKQAQVARGVELAAKLEMDLREQKQSTDRTLKEVDQFTGKLTKLNEELNEQMTRNTQLAAENATRQSELTVKSGDIGAIQMEAARMGELRDKLQKRISEHEGKKYAVDEERDQDRGEGQLHVGDAHHHRVDDAAEIAGEQAQRDADAGGEEDAEEADGQRDPQPVGDGRKQVAALLVGPEQVGRRAQVRPDRRQARVEQVELRRVERVLRRDHAGEDREQEEGDGDDRGGDGQLRAHEARHDVAVEGAEQERGLAVDRRLLLRLEVVGGSGVLHGRAPQVGARSELRRRGSTTV